MFIKVSEDVSVSYEITHDENLRPRPRSMPAFVVVVYVNSHARVMRVWEKDFWSHKPFRTHLRDMVKTDLALFCDDELPPIPWKQILNET